MEVVPNSKIAWISEELCIGCGICVKVGARHRMCAIVPGAHGRLHQSASEPAIQHHCGMMKIIRFITSCAVYVSCCLALL